MVNEVVLRKHLNLGACDTVIVGSPTGDFNSSVQETPG